MFVRNLLAICDEASIWALLAGMCLDGLVHKVHCVRKMQVKADTPMVVYLSCRTLGDCYLVIQSLNGRTVSGMSKYPLLAEVAEPPGTTGKAAALEVRGGAMAVWWATASATSSTTTTSSCSCTGRTDGIQSQIFFTGCPKEPCLKQSKFFLTTGSDLGSLIYISFSRECCVLAMGSFFLYHVVMSQEN